MLVDGENEGLKLGLMLLLGEKLGEMLVDGDIERLLLKLVEGEALKLKLLLKLVEGDNPREE